VPAHPVELALFVLYVTLGPQTWAFYWFMIRAGRRKMLLMKQPPQPLPGPPPRVTLLIPAKDEGERIRGCVASALAQDYPDFQVIAINDRSTDNTGAVMDEMAAADPNLRVLHIKEPPGPGWTGKNNALHQASKLADGEWLLFVDSDVVLEPDALATAISVVRRKQFDLLSLLPKLESHTLWESLLVPLCAGAASSLYLIALTNNAQMNRVAFANGQFMLMSRRAYDAIGGHVAVKDRYCEDVAIAELMKKNGLRPRVSWGNDYAAVRMYSSLPAIFRGWSRIYYAAQAGRPWRILIGITFLLLCGFSILPALAWGVYRLLDPGPRLFGSADWLPGAHWLGAVLAHVLLMTGALATIYRWSGNPGRNALLFLPLGGPMLLATFFKGLKMCVTKKVEWRGTAYAHTMAPSLTVAGSPAKTG
jgi:glycosyltransferase involved in cell wall biosynthesis